MIYMWFIDVYYAINTLTPTISNSSGDYYITQQDFDFNNGIIDCDSDKPCLVTCDNAYSCQNTTVQCNNADYCYTYCYGEQESDACTNIKIYTSSNQTSIVCPWKSCDSLTIFTDYINNPLSNVELICDFESCNSLQIRDAINQFRTGFTRPKQLKIRLYESEDDASMSFPGRAQVLSPDIINSTGEYYYDVGSFAFIWCSNHNLCYIDCAVGGCSQSLIICMNTDECTIKCNDKNDWDVCDLSTIYVSNTNKFLFDCTDATSEALACTDNIFYINHVSSADILCSRQGGGSGMLRCARSTYSIHYVDNLYVECNQPLSCEESVFSINHIKNDASFSCDRGCTKMDIDINNADTLHILCDYSEFKLSNF